MILHNMRLTLAATFINLKKYNAWKYHFISTEKIDFISLPCHNTGSNNLWFVAKLANSILAQIPVRRRDVVSQDDSPTFPFA